MNHAAPIPAAHDATSDAAAAMSPRRARLLVLALVLYGLAIGLPQLGAAPLSSHESLAADRTRGLMTHGRWVVPYRNGQPDILKPPLPFWTGGAVAAAWGEVNEWTARLPTVAATLATMLLLVAWIRRAVHWPAALTTALVFLTCGGALHWGRRAEVDMQLCFWTTAALATYWFALGEPVRLRQVLLFVAMWLSLGLGILAKGPLPLGIWLVTVAGHTILDRQWRQLRQMLPIAGPLIMAAVVLPWAAAVLALVPDAMDIWFHQSLGRAAGELGHEKPWYFYLVQAPLLWMPWLVPVAVGLWRAFVPGGMAKPLRTFLLCWAVGGLTLLSFSAGKRLFYALPCLPPVMILAGVGLDYMLRGAPRRLHGAGLWVFRLHWLAVVGAAVGAWFAAQRYDEFRTPILVVGLIGAMGLAAVLALYGLGRRAASLTVLAAVLLAAFLVATVGIITPMETLGNYHARLGRALAEPSARGDVAVLGEADPELVFYAGRPLPVLKTPDEADAWARSRSRAMLVTGSGPQALQMRQRGPWREVALVPPPGGDMHREDVTYVVLEWLPRLEP
ncbi:MAG: glycosyltransferase family 39 protein [Phycisphaerae bacterium]|nr:glycosyltransferase family 39 protein [Phycisphaerae bacterium]